jgi:hypothetical protein
MMSKVVVALIRKQKKEGGNIILARTSMLDLGAVVHQYLWSTVACVYG